VIDCTNFSGTTETIRAVARNANSALASNVTLTIGHLETRTFATHGFGLFGFRVDQLLATGTLSQGTIAIAATSTNIVCNAVAVDARDEKPTGYSLHVIRFNPIPGTQE